MELGDKNLLVQRASIGIMQAGGSEMSVNAMSLLAGTTSTDLEESRVLQLLNMVTAEELIDTDEYEGMYCATLTSGHTHFLKGTLTRRRNLRRRQGRMRQIWHRARPQNPTSQRWQQTEQRCWQDLYQIRRRGIRRQGPSRTRRTQVCRPNRRHDVLFRSKLDNLPIAHHYCRDMLIPPRRKISKSAPGRIRVARVFTSIQILHCQLSSSFS